MNQASPMRKAIGAVLLMIGVVWFLLAIGFIQGSFMNGSIFWGIVGIALANAGIIILFRKPKPRPPDSRPT